MVGVRLHSEDLDKQPIRRTRRMQVGWPEGYSRLDAAGIIIRCQGDLGVWHLLRDPGYDTSPWSVLVYWPDDPDVPPTRRSVSLVGWLEVGCDLYVDYGDKGDMVSLGRVSMLAIETRRR